MSEYPRKQIMPEGSESPGDEYPFSDTVLIKLCEHDRHGMHLFPGGYADAYWDFEDERWHWSDYTGGPTYPPDSWAYIDE